MKCRFLLPAAVIIAAALPAAPARADAWADYNKLMTRYYLIDKAETAGITCTISAAPLDEVLQKIPSLSDQIAAKLRKFHVSVRPDSGIAFAVPSMSLDGNPSEASADLTKGLTQIVDGVKQISQGVFEGLVMEKQDKLKNLTLTAKDASTTIAYGSTDADGNAETVETTFTGNTDTTKEASKDGITLSTTTYTPLDGKLAISNSKAHRDGAKGFDGTIDVKYQQVQKVWFPSSITTDLKFDKDKPVQHIVVNFTNCGGD